MSDRDWRPFVYGGMYSIPLSNKIRIGNNKKWFRNRFINTNRLINDGILILFHTGVASITAEFGRYCVFDWKTNHFLSEYNERMNEWIIEPIQIT